MQAVMETIFDLAYLTTVITIGIRMIRRSRGVSRQFTVFGWMAVILGAGDAFHLIPRVAALWTSGFEHYTVPLGIGKCVTSVTMTIFYVLLYYVWRARYQVKQKRGLTVLIYLLAALRIILCLLPQNRWMTANPPEIWGVYRNIPFVMLGAIIVVLFFRSAGKTKDRAFRRMWLTIVLSFAFYIPVVLFADRIPVMGMLMIPKTCAYLWTVLIGYNAMRKELQ